MFLAANGAPAPYVLSRRKIVRINRVHYIDSDSDFNRLDHDVGNKAPYFSVTVLHGILKSPGVRPHAGRLELAEWPPAEAAADFLLRGLMELCIYGSTGTGRSASRGCCRDRTAVRRGGKDEDEHQPVPWSCTDDALLQV